METGDWFGFAESEFDWVLNCVSASEPGLEGYRKSYLEGNRTLARWMRETGFAGRAIYTGSVAVYPDSGGDWVEESDASPHSDRARMLLDAESTFLENESEARAMVLRLGGIYGPNRGFLVKRLRESDGNIKGSGDYFLNLIRLEDIVGAIIAGFEGASKEQGVYSIVDDEPMRRRELIEGLAGELGMSAPRFDENAGASRRWDGGPPANRRISNRAFKRDFEWNPQFPNALRGMIDLL